MIIITSFFSTKTVTYSIKYVTHKSGFSPKLVHANIQNKIRQTNRGEDKEKTVTMERSKVSK